MAEMVEEEMDTMVVGGKDVLLTVIESLFGIEWIALFKVSVIKQITYLSTNPIVLLITHFHPYC